MPEPERFTGPLLDTSGVPQDWDPTGGFDFYAGTGKQSDRKLCGTNKYYIQDRSGLT